MSRRDPKDIRRIVAWYVWRQFNQAQTILRARKDNISTMPEHINQMLYQTHQVIDMNAKEYRKMSFRSSMYEGLWRVVYNKDNYRKSPADDNIIMAVSILERHENIEKVLSDLNDWVARIFKENGNDSATFENTPPRTVALIELYYFLSYLVSSMLLAAGDNFWSQVAVTGSNISSSIEIKAFDMLRPVHSQVQVELMTMVANPDDEDDNTSVKTKESSSPNLHASGEISLKDKLAAQSSIAPEVIEELQTKLGVEGEPTTPKPKNKLNLFGSRPEKHVRSLSTSGNGSRVRSDRPDAPELPRSQSQSSHNSPAQSPRLNHSSSASDIPYEHQQTENIRKKELIDHFARYCWRKLDENKDIGNMGIIHDILRDYQDPTDHKFLANETIATLLLEELSLDIRKSNMIRTTIESLVHDVVNFETELAQLLRIKYLGRPGGYETHAIEEDYVDAHRLCILIFVISGLRTRRSRLESQLMQAGRASNTNDEIKLFDRTLEQFVNVQTKHHARFMVSRNNNAVVPKLGRDRSRSVSSPDIHTSLASALNTIVDTNGKKD